MTNVKMGGIPAGEELARSIIGKIGSKHNGAALDDGGTSS